MKLRTFTIMTTVSVIAMVPIFWLWNYLFRSPLDVISPHYEQCVRQHFGIIEAPCTSLSKPLAVIITLIALLALITFLMRSQNYITKRNKYKKMH